MPQRTVGDDDLVVGGPRAREQPHAVQLDERSLQVFGARLAGRIEIELAAGIHQLAEGRRGGAGSGMPVFRAVMVKLLYDICCSLMFIIPSYSRPKPVMATTSPACKETVLPVDINIGLFSRASTWFHWSSVYLSPGR